MSIVLARSLPKCLELEVNKYARLSQRRDSKQPSDTVHSVSSMGAFNLNGARSAKPIILISVSSRISRIDRSKKQTTKSLLDKACWNMKVK